MQNRIGETDVKKKYLDTKWGKQGGMNWEIEINIYTLLMLGIKLIECRIPRIARRDKKAFLSDQCKETEENNRMGKTRDLFKKIRNTKGIFHVKMGTIKDRNGMDLNRSRRY